MKNLLKRGFAVLFALALCVSLLSGLTLTTSAQTVDYVYSGSYIYNWGNRGETATYLSQNAEAFYTGDNTYAELSKLSGSSSESSVPSSALYEALQDLMSSNHSYVTSYEAVKNLCQYTDCQNSGKTSNKISSFYSGALIGPSWDGNWNREHTWPNSKGDLAGSGENDIMMLRPTATSENSSRGNTAYGESAGYYDPNEASGGSLDLRGDVARIMLYTYVRWECVNTGSDYNPNGIFGTGGVIESKAVMLNWIEEDPVDTWELGRNDSVESITGTRNVFVDYPEFAFLLFNEDIPANYTTPSGEAAASAYSITATSNNNAYGTVSMSGTTINAVPATGYYAAGYTVVSGNATVAQNGNAFSVTASSDCTIRINFAPKTAITVTYSENGATTKTVNAYAGDSLVLASPVNAAPEGHTFLGWVTAPVADTTEKPSCLVVGTEQHPTASATYYALYSYAGEGSGDTTETTYTFADYAAGTQYAENEVHVLDEMITVTSLGGHFTEELRLYQSSGTDSTAIISCADVITSFSLNAGYKAASLEVYGSTDGSSWTLIDTLTITSSYKDLTVDMTGTSYTQLKLDALTAQVRVASITVGTSGATATHYLTSTCEHADTTNVAAVGATCTEGGFTAGVYCNDCESYISGHEPVAALGHSYTSVVTPPTVEEQGYTTFTCSRCGDTYKGNYTAALGETYTVSFQVPAGVSGIANMQCNSTGITLPTAGVPTGDYEYSFLGWTTAVVNNVTDEPTYYAAGDTFIAEANTTLIALYTYSVGGGASENVTFELGTDDSSKTAQTDGSKDTKTYSETVGDYTLSLTGGTKCYPDSYDAKGNACIKMGSSSAAGSFAFTVPMEVTSVIIKVAGRATATGKISINGGATQTISTLSNNGEYTDVVVDTSTNKDVSFTTVSGGYRVMINSITYVFSASNQDYYTTVISAADMPDEGVTVSFRVPAGVTGVPSLKTTTGSVTLPNIPTNGQTIEIDGREYVFFGWAPEAVAATTEQPTYYSANSTFEVAADTTLIALYRYNVETEEEIVGGASQNITFELGADGSASHSDGSSKTSYSETVSGYTLSLTASAQFYTGARDAKGNGAIKLGSGKNAGGFSFQVPDDVTSVIIKVAGYKANTGKISINGGATQTISTLSNNGAYTDVVVDTSTDKTVSFTTMSSGYRVMVNSITYVVESSGGGTQTVTTTYYTTVLEGLDVAKFTGSNVTLKDTLFINFYAALSSQYVEAGNLSVEFSYTDRKGNVVTETKSFDELNFVIDHNGYSFTISMVASYMAVDINARLLQNGELIKADSSDNQTDVELSLRTYAMTIINDTSAAYTDAEKAAAKAMLNYGAMAQTYFGVFTDDLANSELDEADKLTDTDAALALITGIDSYSPTVTNKASNFIGYSLLLKDGTGLRLYFTEAVTVTIDGIEQVAVEDNNNAGRYHVEIPAVNAAKLDVAHTVAYGDMTITNLSVLSPAAMVATNESKSTSFRNAMIALILYAQSVKAL